MTSPSGQLNIKQALILTLILLVAFALRVYEIDIRPLHHDEGVNFHFLKGMTERGYYQYSHENYHGPLYFYISKFFLNIFGETELGLRMSSIVAGVALVCLPILMFSAFGTHFTLLAALLLAVTASMVFHSRYAIHEMLFVLTSIWFASASFKWFLNRERRDLYQLFMALSLTIATKETFVISGAATVIGLLMAFPPKKILSQLFEDFKSFGGPFVVFSVLLLGIFSGGFRWFGGIYEMFLAVPQWVGRGTGDTGHFKPFIFYSQVLLKTEPWLMLGMFVTAAFVAAHFIFKGRDKTIWCLVGGDVLLRFLFGLSAGFWVIYGVVSYKTVWLIISQSGAMALTISRFLFLLHSHLGQKRVIASVLSAITVLIASYYSWYFNFKFPYGQEHPYCYVHTSEGMVRLVGDIEGYQSRNPKSRILVGVGSYWPLPFYFKDYSELVAYPGDSKPQDYLTNYDIIIVDAKHTAEISGWNKRYYRLSGVQESTTYFRNR